MRAPALSACSLRASRERPKQFAAVAHQPLTLSLNHRDLYYAPMTKLLDLDLEKFRKLPADQQDEIAHAILSLTENDRADSAVGRQTTGFGRGEMKF